MDVRIVQFPDTPVAVAEHRGPPSREYETARRLIAWRIANGVSPAQSRSFGVHFDNPLTTPPAEYRVDFCVEFAGDVQPNEFGVIAKRIPGGRCAVARHVGSREHIEPAEYLPTVWLPASGEVARDFPMFFHYVNVGPHIDDADMITDVYLPLL